MNACAFGVTSGKFLGFVVCHGGIEVDPTKIKAMVKLSVSKNLRELKWFQSRLTYIYRFISNLHRRCEPFSRLTKKDVAFQWEE